MSKKLQLSIHEPCHENWEAMTPVEKGKFCGSCQKQVVDFSNMSDRQVAEFFKKPSTGSVCGRFMNDQLDRAIEIPRKRIPWLKYFVQILIPAFLVSCRNGATVGKVMPVEEPTKNASRFENLETTVGIILPEITPVVGATVVIDENITTKPKQVFRPYCDNIYMPGNTAEGRDVLNGFSGKVIDEFGVGIAFANVEVAGNERYETSEDGQFTIKQQWIKSNLELVVSSIGYKTDTIILNASQVINNELVIKLKSNVTLPEVVVTSMGMIVVGKVLEYTTCKVEEKRSTKVNSESKVKVEPIKPSEDVISGIFPNPVEAGGIINLQYKSLTPGIYQFQLVNSSGQVILQKQINIDAKAGMKQIKIPRAASGIYFVVVSNSKTVKKYTEKLIIQ